MLFGLPASQRQAADTHQAAAGSSGVTRIRHGELTVPISSEGGIPTSLQGVGGRDQADPAQEALQGGLAPDLRGHDAA